MSEKPITDAENCNLDELIDERYRNALPAPIGNYWPPIVSEEPITDESMIYCGPTWYKRLWCWLFGYRKWSSTTSQRPDVDLKMWDEE